MKCRREIRAAGKINVVMRIDDEIDEFWRSCCKCGISICQIPKPFSETELVWLVEKNKTFFDHRLWKAQHTFDNIQDVFLHVGNYLSNGNEPVARAEGRS